MRCKECNGDGQVEREYDEALKMALAALEKIYEGCGHVIDYGPHKEAATVAKLVRKDCLEPIQAVRGVVDGLEP
jgi:hypothetical protein